MAFMAAALPYLQAAGAALSVAGAAKSASAANAAARAQQEQLNAAAMQEDAAGQHRAEIDRRKADLMLSRALALGASSGAGTSGLDSVLRGIAQEGETAAGYSLYESTEKAKGMRYSGEVGVSEARARGKATMMQATAGAAMSLAGKYGGGGSGGWFSSGTSAPIEERVSALR